MSVDRLHARGSALSVLEPSLRAAFATLPDIKGGSLRVRLADGRTLAFGDGLGPCAELAVHDYRFARRVLFSGDIGFAEGWVEGEWSSPDLITLLSLLAKNVERLAGAFRGGAVGWLANRLSHLGRANTRKGARRNIIAHYDLGNAFFAAWLDPSMTYSSARFVEAGADLASAQAEKYRAIARHAQLKGGDHVLEIGCGWGGFAEIAAREFGARVTALTLSDEQFAYAQARMQRAGLADRVSVRRQDYRDVQGPFDAVVSIEMLEAVGEAYWPAYFGKIAEVLRPGGRAAVQTITIRDDLFEDYRRRADFIQRYVFPGGMLPSLARLREEAAAAALQWQGFDAFGRDYDRTLSLWFAAFEANWPRISAQGFDERFRRLWLFYLAYCIAGFRTGRIDVIQLALTKPL
ncbi:MAG TPA: cyclopropane-fatty-acyl-phospholipid synthase family protein [Terricaulis sp.]|nr:cyclopropane-fatty-acyl-phospholipid synthase family protein [Terricaulis sp.]